MSINSAVRREIYVAAMEDAIATARRRLLDLKERGDFDESTRPGEIWHALNDAEIFVEILREEYERLKECHEERERQLANDRERMSRNPAA